MLSFKEFSAEYDSINEANNVITSYAKQSGKTEKEVEELWNKAKDIVKEEYGISDGGRFYSLVTGTLKKMLGL